MHDVSDLNMASLLLYCADAIKGDLDSLRDEVRDHYR